MEHKNKLSQLMRDFFLSFSVDRTYHLALSGGLDSSVLLALCVEQQSALGFKLQAIHINHQVSAHAAKWADFCKSLCLTHNIQFIEKKVEIDHQSESGFEAEARQKRYAALASCLAKDDVLLTAHHQDDQAETLLLQLLRGAGPKGLSAMPVTKTLGHGLLARPLLSVTREALRDYAESMKLAWVDDESNTNKSYSRNYLRHDVLPVLTKRFPKAIQALARSANHCAESQALLEEYALSLLKEVEDKAANHLSITKLRALTLPQQRLVVRTWLAQQNVVLPDTIKMDVICHEIIIAGSDRNPCLTLANGYQIRRFRDALCLVQPLPAVLPSSPYSWQLPDNLTIAGIGTLCAQSKISEGIAAHFPTVTVKFRAGGEMIWMAKRGRHSLKKMLQEWSVPIWMRERLPLLFIGEELVAVVGYFIDDRYKAKAGEAGFLPHFDAV